MKYEYFTNINYHDISKHQKVSNLVAKAIEAYHLNLDKEAKLESPYKYVNMQNVVGYLFKAINNKRKIMVYGDYDVDGICSVAILKRMFSLLNTEIGYYIPNRYIDGYGINTKIVSTIKEKNYNLIICIDNGINANEAIDLANELGIDVIVLDHHQLNGERPNCKYFLHPTMSNFVDYNMCASSIAYYLSMAMLDKDDEKSAILAGIATLSDVMPLVKQNKLLVKNAINLLNKQRYKNLDLLIDESEYDETVLSMSLIPKLNSIGRIIKDTKVNLIIKFLFEENDEKILEYLHFVLECNKNRKSISDDFYEKTKDIHNDTIIIVKDDELPEGVCGIVASRISNTKNIPAIVFAKSHDNLYYKGSARSLEGINIVEALSKLDYLVNFGGHEKAAGLTIKIEDFEKFKLDMEHIIVSYSKIEEVKKVILLEEKELGYKEYLELLKYGPFGESNPFPIFGIKNISKDKISFSKDKKHLLIKLNNDVTLLGFNLANKYQEKYNNYEAIFTLGKNNLIKNKLSCKCLEITGGI